jgi:hypothetical protein
MTLTPSRTLSLVIVGLAYFRAWQIGLSGWYVTMWVTPLLVLIWFPDEVDDLTFGSWYEGRRIDSHTPPFLIAAFGWIFLATMTLFLFIAHEVLRRVAE